MSGLEFISTLIGQLISWPVAVLVAVFALRKPIAELLPNLKSYEGMGQKLSFGDRLAETEESVDRAVGSIEDEADPKQEEPKRQKQADDDEFAALVREAEANPSYVILGAWEQFAGTFNDLVGTLPGAERLRRNPYLQLRELQQRGLINSDFAQAVKDLRDLRNRVAHGQHNPTSGEAVAYVESARELTRAVYVLITLQKMK